MPTCLLTNPVVNHNLLAKYLVSRGVTCFAYIDMAQVDRLPSSVKTRGRDFDSDLYEDVFLSNDDLPDPATCPFDAVLAGGELGVEDADRLAAHYGCTGNDPTSSHLRRDKDAMQDRLAEAGLPHIRSVEVTSGTDIATLSATLGDGPYILKPRNAAGGESLRFCPNAAALAAAVAAVDWGAINCTWKLNEAFVAQEYITGTEYVVDLVARDGEIVVSAISRYIRLCDLGDWAHPNVKRFLVLEDPADSVFTPLLRQAKACCQALGIRQGAAHMEFIDGPQGCYMVEVGARLHGSLCPMLFRECFEDDLLGSLHQATFETTPLRPGRLRKHGLQSLIIAERNGVFSGFSVAETQCISDNGSLLASDLTFRAGESYPRTVDEVNIPAKVFFTNWSRDRLLADVCEFDGVLNAHFNGRPYGLADIYRWTERPCQATQTAGAA